MRIRQKDISEELGVSQSTVSLVMRNPATPRVSQKLRDRILGYVQELETDGRRVPSRLSGNVCFLIPREVTTFDFYEFFFGNVLHGVEEEVEKRERGLFFKSWEQADDVESLLRRGDISGVIGLFTLPQDMIESFQEHGPVVLIDVQQRCALCDCVMGDRRGGARALMDVLFEKGHRRIAFAQRKVGKMIWHRHHELIHLSAYMESLVAKGIPFRQEYVVEVAYGKDDYAGAIRNLMELPEPPTAIMAFNDWLAVRLIHGAETLGVSVPDELSFVGFDDFAPEDLWHPNLTTVSWDRRHIGRVAAQILFQRLESGNWHDPQITLCPLELVERESVVPVGNAMEGM